MELYNKIEVIKNFIKKSLSLINKHSSALNIMMSFVMTFSTVLLALYNYNYLKLTQLQLGEIKKQREFTELQLKINNSSEITILTPDKEEKNNKLFAKITLDNKQGTAKNVEIYAYILNTDAKKSIISNYDLSKHYVNSINQDKKHWFSIHLPEEFKWIKDSMGYERNVALRLTVIVKYIQPPILPEDIIQPKFESASFFWDKNRDQWGNLDGIENIDLLHLLKENGLCADCPPY